MKSIVPLMIMMMMVVRLIEEGKKTKEISRNITSIRAIFHIASSWKVVKTTTLANGWKDLLYDAEDVEYDFEGFETNKFHRELRKAGEEVSLEDVREWLEETEGDPGHHVMTEEEIAEDVLKDDTIEKEEEDGGKESDVRIPKISEV